MIGRDDYTPQEWKALVDLPKHVALSVIASGRSGPIQLYKENAATSRAMEEAKASPVPLVVAVAHDIRAQRDIRAAVASGEDFVPEQDTEKVKAQALSLIATVNQILADKNSTEEAEGYKRWVIEVARTTAEAAKEGGILGIGGKRVTSEEQATIASLATALGVAAD
jgi:hypothetical protein